MRLLPLTILALASQALVVCHAQTTRLRIVHPTEQAVIQTDTASPIENYAALELQRAIRLMTGQQLNIIHKDVTTSLGKIIIGNTQTNSRVSGAASVLQLNGGGDEKIAVKKEGYILYLAGNTPRGALYATYTFLDSLGMRWFWPDTTGEFIPHKDSIVIDYPLFIAQKPNLDVRSIAVTGLPNSQNASLIEQTDTWMARNRLNWVSDRNSSTDATVAARRQKGFLIRRAGHNIAIPNEIITTTRLQGADSVLAALRNGKRQKQATSSSNEHMCWSNPRGWDSVAKMIVSWWNKTPYPDIIHFYPTDNQRYCQCAACLQMALPDDGDNTNDITTRWQKFSDSVLKRVDILMQQQACTNLPNSTPNVLRCKEYWTYAYWDYKKAPSTAAAPFQLIPYALSDACYRHLLGDVSNTDDAAEKAEIDQWLALQPQRKMGIRGYEFIPFKTPLYLPMVSWVTDEMRWMMKKGLGAYMSEIPYYGSPMSAEPELTWWNCSRMSLYAAAKSMWDTATRADKIVSDWCNRVYGPAGGDMNNLYWDMDSAWRAGTTKLTGFLKTPRLYLDGFTSASLFHKTYKRFADAFEKIATNIDLDSNSRKRIETQILLERELMDNWMDTFQTAESRMMRYNMEILPRVNMINPTEIPAFEVGFEQPSTIPTRVTAGWTSGNLHLRITPPEQSLVMNTTLTRNDAQTFTNGFEIYIQPDSARPEFYRILIHPQQGTYSDAKTYSGITYDAGWNATNSIWVGTNSNDSLVINVQISFASLGLTGADNTQFKLGIRRKASNGTLTGWPEAQSNYAGLFSKITLRDAQSGSSIMVRGEAKSSSLEFLSPVKSQ